MNFKKFSRIIKTLIILVLVTSCNVSPTTSSGFFDSSTSLTTSADSSIITKPTDLVSINKKILTAIEISKLPSKLEYTSNESIALNGGELRVVYSDYSVRYLPLNDTMLDVNRLNISTLGTKNVFIKYQENDITLYTSFQVKVIPFIVKLASVEFDIKSLEIYQNQSFELNVLIDPLNAKIESIVWSSSNNLIAKVDSNGYVTTLNPGKAFISARVNSNFTAVSEINVIPVEIESVNEIVNFNNVDTIAISVSNFGSISGDTPTNGGTLKYSISQTSKTSQLASLTEISTESDVNSFLTTPLGVKPTIVATDNQKYLIVVELDNNSNVIAVGQEQIGLQDIIGYTFGITSFGVIGDDTPLHGGRNWYAIVNSNNQAAIATWNMLTTKSEIEADINGTLSLNKPTLDYTHVGKYLVIVELYDNDSKVAMADDRLIVSTDIYNLNISVNDSAVISGNTSQTSGSSLFYLLTNNDITSTINTWNTSTTFVSVQGDVVGTYLNSISLSHHDYSKYLTVIEEKAGKIVAAGITQVLINPNNALLLHLGSSFTGSTWNDLSSPAYNASLINTPTKLSNGIELNGSSQAAWVAHNTALKPTFGITMEQWLFANDWNYNNAFYLASISTTQGGGYAMSLASQKLGVEIRANNTYQDPEISTQNLVGWQHIVATFDGRYSKIFLNGNLLITEDAGDYYPIQYAYDNALFIGAEADTDNNSTPDTHYWNGKIGMTKLYGVALHPSLVLESYNQTKGLYTNISTAGLVRHFDAGNTLSYSGSGSTWTDLVNNTNYTISGTSSYNSANGGSIEFNGTNTFVNIGTPLSSGASFTKEAWVYADVVTSSRNIISSNKNVFWNNESTLGGGINSQYSTVTSTNFPAGVWKHVVLTFNNSNKEMKLYIDGVLKSTATATGLSYASEVESIGSHPQNNTATTNASYWDGKIAQVRIYNLALTEQQVTQNYNETKARFQ